MRAMMSFGMTVSRLPPTDARSASVVAGSSISATTVRPSSPGTMRASASTVLTTCASDSSGARRMMTDFAEAGFACSRSAMRVGIPLRTTRRDVFRSRTTLRMSSVTSTVSSGDRTTIARPRSLAFASTSSATIEGACRCGR